MAQQLSTVPSTQTQVDEKKMEAENILMIPIIANTI